MLQSLTLWKNVQLRMFKLWHTVEADMLDSTRRYKYQYTGQVWDGEGEGAVATGGATPPPPTAPGNGLCTWDPSSPRGPEGPGKKAKAMGHTAQVICSTSAPLRLHSHTDFTCADGGDVCSNNAAPGRDALHVGGCTPLGMGCGARGGGVWPPLSRLRLVQRQDRQRALERSIHGAYQILG